ncbi:hypothetical protein KY358_03545 [Candidatus Woesearchaeota archaeon]|nr:hypothetical protein [Candidatus Woesearchaeota archaeon]
MLSFLKKLFSRQEEEVVEREEIQAGQLMGWFDARSDKIISGLDSKLESIRYEIRSGITKAKDSLAVLSTAKLHNPDITVKEMQFMEGNRKSYILAVNNLLRGIELEGRDYSSLVSFCEDFISRLDNFSRSTLKPYQILQEFFSHESRDVALAIKKIDGSIKGLKEAISRAEIFKIEEIKKSILDLHKRIRQKRDIDGLLSSKSSSKQSLMKSKSAIEKEISTLSGSREYRKLNDLTAGKEAVLAGIRDHNSRIIHAFSVMEKPLRKLQRMVLQEGELLQAYLENPVKALVNDNGLNVIGLLKKLEKNINNCTLDLKDKKREKVLETLKGLTEEFLREFINKHNEMESSLKGLEDSIEENEALKKENKLNYELSNMEGSLEKLNSEILSYGQELSRMNIAGIKESLSEKINSVFHSDIVIV